ncbi:MAG TPA: hypothetical protein VNG31_01480 [Candidatus Baltobacteraceae bacterium]|nr:hypothetical protein [Candidatus Baltobacteraceae bacterium]
MTQNPDDVGSTFARGWTLLSQNPVIVVPGLVLGAIGGIAIAAVVLAFIGSVIATGATHSVAVGATSLGLTTAAGIVLILALTVVQTTATTAMAVAAWERGSTTLADAWAALSLRGWQMLAAVVLLFFIGCAALLLAPFTLLVSLLAYVIFFMYVAPSVVEGRPAGEAIAESCRLAARNLGPSAGIAVLVMVISVIAGIVGSEIGRVELFFGGLAAAALQQAAVAYAIVVIVGEYRKLRNQ